MIALAFLAAISTPTDRTYVLAESERPTAELTQCAQVFFDKGGRSSIEAQPYGQRVDYRYANLGGAVKEPTMSLEIHDGEKRTLLLYGFGPFRGATKNMWRQMAKDCFPEQIDAPVVKPAKS